MLNNYEETQIFAKQIKVPVSHEVGCSSLVLLKQKDIQVQLLTEINRVFNRVLKVSTRNEYSLKYFTISWHERAGPCVEYLIIMTEKIISIKRRLHGKLKLIE